jgi:DNA primase
MDYKTTGDVNEIRICCPYCVNYGKTPDTEYHLYIDKKNKIFHCFRCNKAGVLAQLTDKLKYTPVFLPEPEKRIEYKKQEEYLDFFGNSLSQRIARKYWKSRGLTEQEAKEYQVKVDKNNFAIVIPVRDENGFKVYDIKRSCLKTNDRKYYIEKGSNKSKYLFNFDKAKEYKQIYLVEGVFDAISIGKQGVAMFGKFLSDTQLELLQHAIRVSKIGILLDTDANTEALNLFDRLLPYFDVSLLGLRDTGCKDIAEYREIHGKVSTFQWLQKSSIVNL